MIRLFKQVYLAPDTFFDWSKDRITLSKNVGSSMAHQLDEVVRGKTYYYSQGWDPEDLSFESLIKFADEMSGDDAPLVIYADEDVFPVILTTWLRNIAPGITVSQIDQFYQSELYTANYIDGRTGDDITIDHKEHFKLPTFNQQTFEEVWDVEKTSQSFLQWIEENSHSFELAFLIATYMANGQYKDKIQKFFIRNVRSFVYKHLFDIKREVSQRVLFKDFADKMGCKKYTPTNINEISKDDAPLIEVLYSSRIFQDASKIYKENKLNKEGIGINWDKITDDDIDKFAQIVEITNVPIGLDTIDEFKWILSVARNSKVADNDLDRILEREQHICQTDVGNKDRFIDYTVCSAMFITHMLQQEQSYMDKLKIV
jgi:hypothetical protein